MTAPNTIAVGTLAGIDMVDGFSIKLAIGRDPTFSLWEVSVTPPAIEGGDAISRTTHRSDTYRAMAARQLVSLEEFQVVGRWDPNNYSTALDLINKEGEITIHFPDGSTLDFYGYMRRFEPGEFVEGEPPEATATIVPTLFDTTAYVEEGWVMTEVSGT